MEQWHEEQVSRLRGEHSTTTRMKGSVMRQADSPRWCAVLSFLCRDPWQAVAMAVIMKESKALAV